MSIEGAFAAGSTVGILIGDIDKRLQGFEQDDYYRLRREESQRTLKPKDVLTAAQVKLFEQLKDADAELYTAKLKVAKLKEKLVKSAKLATNGRDEGSYELTTKNVRHANERFFSWNEYVIRETWKAVQKRIGDTKESRAKRRSALRDLRERVMLASAAGEDLTPFIKEFGSIK